MEGNEIKLICDMLRRIGESMTDFANRLCILTNCDLSKTDSECEPLSHLTLHEEGLVCASKSESQGYQMVDLGLPSGLKWADRNVGAVNVHDYGDYFMWGSTEPDTEKVCDLSHRPFDGGIECLSEELRYFKDHRQEWLTDEGVLKPEYDAVHVIMGGDWRMPTDKDFEELFSNTISSNETVGNIGGKRLTSKTNGKSIFIPFNGWMNFKKVYCMGEKLALWSSIASKRMVECAIGFFCGKESQNKTYSVLRAEGFGIRGVHG